MTIQGYLMLRFDDSGRTLFDQVFQGCDFKFNIMAIAGCISGKSAKRRHFWDWIDAEAKWYKWEQLTLDELIEMVASGRVEIGNHHMGHLQVDSLFKREDAKSGTADSGTTTTTVDAERTEVDDFWNDTYVTFTSGPNSGLTRKITDFDADTDTITHEAFPNAVAAGHTYNVGPRLYTLRKEILAANDLCQLLTGQDFTFDCPPHGVYDENIRAVLDEWFAHWTLPMYAMANYATARNDVPPAKRLKTVSLSDKEIEDNGWTNVDACLDDARNNKYLHVLVVHDVSDTNLTDKSRNLSLANWATLKSKLADFHSEDRLVLISDLGTLV